MWHVSSRSGVATLRTAIHLLLTYLRKLCVPRSGDAENARQVAEKDGADPGRRAMRARRPEVPVDDDHRDENGEDVHDEREEQVLGDQRDVVGRRRENLRHEQ